MIKRILLLILFLVMLPGLRKVGGGYCINASATDMVRVQQSDTLERFSEIFNFSENCWTSEEVIDEDYFQMDIPLRDNDIKMHLEFRYGNIQKLECFMKDVKIPCDTITNPKVKLNNNLQVLLKYAQRSR